MNYTHTIKFKKFRIIHRVSPAICFSYYLLAKSDIDIFPFSYLEIDKKAIKDFQQKFGITKINKREKETLETVWIKWNNRLMKKGITSIEKGIENLHKITGKELKCLRKIREEFINNQKEIKKIIERKIGVLLRIDFPEILKNNEKIMQVSYNSGKAYFYYHFLDTSSCQSERNKFIIGGYFLKNTEKFKKVLYHELRHILFEKIKWHRDREIKILLKKVHFPSQLNMFWGDKKTIIEEILNMVIDAIQFGINDIEKIFPFEPMKEIGKIFWKRREYIKKGEIKQVIKLSLLDIIKS